MMASSTPIFQTKSLPNIESLIIELRNHKVILDSDVASIYGVETKRINEAVQRNTDKFPPGYILELNQEEWQSLKSQNAISITGNDEGLKSHFATSKGGKVSSLSYRKGSRTILKSKQATQATLRIIETFAKVREFSRVAKTLAIEKDQSAQKKLIKRSGELISDILNQEFAGDTSSETTIELNLAMIKIKHTIKKENR